MICDGITGPHIGSNARDFVASSLSTDSTGSQNQPRSPFRIIRGFVDSLGDATSLLGAFRTFPALPFGDPAVLQQLHQRHPGKASLGGLPKLDPKRQLLLLRPSIPTALAGSRGGEQATDLDGSPAQFATGLGTFRDGHEG